jgi:hypothetical protein
MLSLTDQQLDLVKQAATMVPVPDRDNFLRSEAAQLVRHPPTDTDLAAALSFVLQGRDISASRSMFLNNQPWPRRFRRATEANYRRT